MAESGMKDLLMLGAVGVAGYFIYEWLFAPAATTAVQPAPAPGTTPTQQSQGGQTSVSTAPSTTAQTPSPIQTLAANMQASLGQATATADQWDVAFTRVMGQSIDSKYGLSFDTVYGPVVNGVRNNGATMNALMFLQMAAQAVPGGLPGLSGLGAALVRYPGMIPQTMGSMMTIAHHPLPYALTYTLRGLGAFNQPTGLERSLFAGRPFHPTRVLGRRVR